MEQTRQSIPMIALWGPTFSNHARLSHARNTTDYYSYYYNYTEPIHHTNCYTLLLTPYLHEYYMCLDVPIYNFLGTSQLL